MHVLKIDKYTLSTDFCPKKVAPLGWKTLGFFNLKNTPHLIKTLTFFLINLFLGLTIKICKPIVSERVNKTTFSGKTRTCEVEKNWPLSSRKWERGWIWLYLYSVETGEHSNRIVVFTFACLVYTYIYPS